MPLVDRIERRVAATFLMMSYTGRVIVVKSLLSSIPTFIMCSIPKILEKIRRDCLWNKKMEDGENVIHLQPGIWFVSQRKKRWIGCAPFEIT
jgi:hypothetical protein